MLNELMEDMREGSFNEVDESSLSKVAKVAELQIKLEQSVADLEEKLAEEKKKLDEVRNSRLPAIMTECGLSEFKLTSGRKITVKKIFSGTINDENRLNAYSWLNANGFGDLIKHKVAVDISRSQEDQLNYDKLVEYLEQTGICYEDKESVHPQTLNAFIKEQVTGGNSEFPLPIFNGKIFDRTVIK